MQPEKSEPKGEQKMPEAREIDAEQEIPTRGYTENDTCRKQVSWFPVFRHFPFTLKFGFLGLHRRPMIGYFILIIGKIVFLKLFMLFLLFFCRRHYKVKFDIDPGYRLLL